MQTFLLVAAGVVVGLALSALLAVGWIKNKIGGACGALLQLVQASGIPPFRIHLQPNSALTWKDAEAIKLATTHFEAVGYARVGDYEVREMNAVRIRAFSHPETGFLVALYDHDEAGVFADLFRDFTDGTSVTISTAAETGMDRPIDAPLFRLEEDLKDPATAQRLHDCLAHEAIGREAYDWGPEDFGDIFGERYAREMDWRIARGGVSRAEIERIAEMSGEGPASDAQVEMIQTLWAGAIATFIDEEVQREWLSESGMAAADWEEIRDRIVVMHDQSDRESWIDALAWRMADVDDNPDDDACDAAHAAARAKLTAAFEGEPMRDAFTKAQAMLPEKRRYERMGSLEHPWKADVWSQPIEADF